MISANKNNPNTLVFQYVQLAASVLALVVVAVFLKYSLQSTSTAFRDAFERQSLLEMSRGDTFLLARRLAALAKSNQISCAIATKNDIVFFEERKGNCRRGFFRTLESIKE